MLDRDRLADARRTDDEHHLALLDGEVHALQHRLASKCLLHVLELDVRGHRSPPVRNSAAAEITKSRMITAKEDPITAAVVAQPTPSELPRARRPQNPATTGMAAPYARALTTISTRWRKRRRPKSKNRFRFTP